MTKNFSKFLAIGASFALASAGLSAPANAAGLADKSFVSLLPETGTEYTVLHDQYFDLKSNAASTIASAGNIKFLVEDTTAKTLFDVDVNGASTDAVTAAVVTNGIGIAVDDATVVADPSGAAGADTLTFTTGFAHGLAVGDTLKFGAPESINTTVTAVSGQVVTIAANISAVSADFRAAGDIVKLSSQSSTTAMTLYTTAAHSFKVGETVVTAGFADITADGDSMNASQVITAVTANSISFTLATPAAAPASAVAIDDNTNANTLTRTNSTVLESRADIITAGSAHLGVLGLIGATPVVQTTAWASPSNGRKSATDGTYVVDTNVASASDDKVLRLVNTGADSLSVNVTAWVDANDNGAIDATEYTSETRTVTFKKASELTFATTFSPNVGEELLTAKFATTPVLNGQQVDAQDGSSVFGAKFTRQDSTDADNYAADGDSTWNDTLKLWTSTVSMDLATLAWTGLTQATGKTPSSMTHVDGVVTVNATGHALRVGDLVDFGASITSTLAAADTALDTGDAGIKVTSVPSADSFTLALAGSSTIAGVLDYVVVTFSGNDAITDRVFPGTHTVRPFLGTTALGTAAVTAVTGAAVSASAAIATVGSTTIQPGSFTASADANNVEVKKATTSVPVTVTVYDAAGDEVAAGKNVTVVLGTPNEGAKTGTFTLDGAAVTSKILTTDANGKVAFTIGENDGDVAAQVRVTATPEGVEQAAVSLDLIWNDVVYGLYDLKNPSTTSYLENRTVNKNGSYTFELAVLDQWKAGPADGAFRLKVDNAGNTVSSAYHALVSGRVNVTVTDGQIGAGTVIDTDITLQKLNLDGLTYTDQTSVSWNDSGLGDIAINVKDQTDKVVLDVDNSTLYGNDTADLSDAQALKATVAQDRRTTVATQPVYSNAVTVSGRIANSVTNAVRPGALVTLSGPASVLFSEGGVDSFGSITVIADGSGEFGVDLYSNTAQTDSVITVTSNGASSTVKVTFTGSSATDGTSLVIDAPVSAASGSTFQVTATLKDKYGNPVQVTDTADILVTYSGPGIVFGTLPNTTDKNGQLKFAVLLGTNDKGTATVTVSYDRSSDGDFTGTTAADLDLVVSKTIIIGEAPTTTKVNAGSFKGYVAVYAKGHEGKRLSAKVGKDWVVVPVLASNFERVVEFTGAGYTVAVRIYIDRVLIDTITVTTK